MRLTWDGNMGGTPNSADAIRAKLEPFGLKVSYEIPTALLAFGLGAYKYLFVVWPDGRHEFFTKNGWLDIPDADPFYVTVCDPLGLLEAGPKG